jgi:putative ABC transport system permease protein
MLKNYLKIAIRNIRRNKVHFIISVFGLAIGMAAAILIMLWVLDELGHDGYHVNGKNIYHVYKSVYTKDRDFWTLNTSAPLAADLKENYPEIINTSRLARTGELITKYQDKLFTEKNIACVDPSYFSIFTFPFIKGNNRSALSNRNSIVVTEDFAKKYFSDEIPIGKTIHINNNSGDMASGFDCIVTGVIKNIPLNTNFRFEAFLPFDFIKELGADTEHYGMSSVYTYVQVKDNSNYDLLNRKIFESFVNSNYQPGITEKYYLIPVTEVRFYRNMHQILVDVFSILAIVVLLIACINYVNISTAQSLKRAGEVGVRKVFGANLRQLRYQFIGESLFLAFIALCTALLLVNISLPVFNYYSGKQIVINYLNFRHIILLIGVFITTGIFAGMYPAFVLSSFNPLSVLKKNIPGHTKRGLLRRALVIIQFSFSIILIISTVYLYRQIDFLQHSDFGFDNSNIIFTFLKGELSKKFDYVKNDLMKNPNVVSVTSSNNLPNSNGSYEAVSDEVNPSRTIYALWDMVDYDYLKTFNMKLMEGRFFSRNFSFDNSNSVIVNKLFVKSLGLKNPIGHFIKMKNKEYSIIGVVKDFHSRPLVYPTEPMILTLKENSNGILFIKLKADTKHDIASIVNYVKNVCARFSPDYPLEYHYLNEVVLEGTDDMTGVAKVLLFFTILGIALSCLGLYGLASFMVEQRTKEIGIRKVLGGSVAQLIGLFSKEFIILIIVANLIAQPIAYLFTKEAIKSAYTPSFNIWIFIVTAVAVILLAIVTVGFHAIKVAIANPVESLRYE